MFINVTNLYKLKLSLWLVGVSLLLESAVTLRGRLRHLSVFTRCVAFTVSHWRVTGDSRFISSFISPGPLWSCKALWDAVCDIWMHKGHRLTLVFPSFSRSAFERRCRCLIFRIITAGLHRSVHTALYLLLIRLIVFLHPLFYPGQRKVVRKVKTLCFQTTQIDWERLGTEMTPDV